MKNEKLRCDIPVRADAYTLENLIGGIHDLAEGVRRAAFGWNESHYSEDATERSEWFCTNYTMVSGAIRLIEAAASIVDVGFVNSDIEIIRGS